MWEVKFSGKAAKQPRTLPEDVLKSLKALIADLQRSGPVLPLWPGFGKITGQPDCYHCHLKKGRPTYVVVWKSFDQAVRLVVIRYLGTHEGAHYGRIC